VKKRNKTSLAPSWRLPSAARKTHSTCHSRRRCWRRRKWIRPPRGWTWIHHLPRLSYGPPWAHYLGGYQDRLLGGPLGLPGLRYTASEGVEHKDYTGVVLG
jgi:hypothetical protein